MVVAVESKVTIELISFMKSNGTKVLYLLVCEKLDGITWPVGNYLWQRVSNPLPNMASLYKIKEYEIIFFSPNNHSF